jgi:hypothetical protein
MKDKELDLEENESSLTLVVGVMSDVDTFITAE